MAGKTKLIAKERFFYGGKTVDKGEEFEAETQDVGLLTAAFKPMADKKGNDVAPLSTKDLQPEIKPAPVQSHGAATAKKVAGAAGAAAGTGRYSRRDMKATD